MYIYLKGRCSGLPQSSRQAFLFILTCNSCFTKSLYTSLGIAFFLLVLYFLVHNVVNIVHKNWPLLYFNIRENAQGPPSRLATTRNVVTHLVRVYSFLGIICMDNFGFLHLHRAMFINSMVFHGKLTTKLHLFLPLFDKKRLCLHSYILKLL